MATLESETNELESAVATASPEPEVKPSESKEGITSEPTYTPEQLRKAISNALATQGGTLGRERDTFKSQAETAAKSLSQAQETIAELQTAASQLREDMALLDEEDPEKTGKLSKRLNDLDAAIKTAKAKETAADARVKEMQDQMTPYAEIVDFALGVTLEHSIFEVSEEYQDGNADTLVELCEQMGVKGDKDKEQLKVTIRKVADILWSKKSTETKEPVLVGDSGVTSGGSGWNPDEHTPGENIERGLKLKKK